MARDLALTFSGGGNRALLQVGLMRRWWPWLEPRIAAVSTVSAGASMALSTLVGRERETTAYWFGRRSGVRHNVQWSRLLKRERPTPHTPIYRDTIRYALAEGGFARLVELPFPFHILAARPPRRWPLPMAVVVGMSAYSLERKLRPGQLHPGIGRRLGFQPMISDLRHCRRPEEVVDQLLASAAAPPFTPVGRQEESPLLDGGLVDNAPAFVAESVPGVRRNLVLLTRPYPAARVGRRGARWYLSPDEPVPVSRWEYTRPDHVAATIALGDRMAVQYQSALREFLDE